MSSPRRPARAGATKAARATRGSSARHASTRPAPRGQGTDAYVPATEPRGDSLPAPPSEQLLLELLAPTIAARADAAAEQLTEEAVADTEPGRALCVPAGRGQWAMALATALPKWQVEGVYLDCFRHQQALSSWDVLPENLRLSCAADLPAGPADLVALPTQATGEAELVRDLLQAAHGALVDGGKLWAATDNPKDRWLAGEIEKLFGAVTRIPFKKRGVAYIARRTGPLKKVKDHSCTFAFRDQGRLIHAYSRPGVFAHRRLDLGARRLLDAMEITPGMRVLDLGCGSGCVALAAALRTPEVQVHAIDSSARAVECTRRGVELNQLTNVTVEIAAAPAGVGGGPYDLVLANPPYFANFQIAAAFLQAAQAVLKRTGKVLVVSKTPDWYAENMGQWFNQVELAEAGGYHLAIGTRPRKAPRGPSTQPPK